MQAEVKEICVRHINLNDDRYRTGYGHVSPLSDPEYMKLVRSIRKSGIINIPLLTPDPDSLKNGFSYIPVSGFKRLHAAIDLGMDTVLCRISKDPAPDLFRTAVTENAYIRKFSELDMAVIIRKFMLLTESNDVSEFLPHLDGIPGFEMNRDYAHRLLAFENLPDDIKSAVSRGFLSPVLASDVAASPGYEKSLFFFEHLKMGLNLQREFWNLVHEISKIKDCSVTDILGSSVFSEIMESSMEVAKKRELVSAELKKTRYPHIEKARTFFSETASGLLKGNTEITISHPKNYESRDIPVMFRFRNRNEYKKIVGILERIGDDPGLDSLLSYNLNI